MNILERSLLFSGLSCLLCFYFVLNKFFLIQYSCLSSKLKTMYTKINHCLNIFFRDVFFLISNQWRWSYLYLAKPFGFFLSSMLFNFVLLSFFIWTSLMNLFGRLASSSSMNFFFAIYFYVVGFIPYHV